MQSLRAQEKDARKTKESVVERPSLEATTIEVTVFLILGNERCCWRPWFVGKSCSFICLFWLFFSFRVIARVGRHRKI